MALHIVEHADLPRFCDLALPLLMPFEAEYCTLVGLVQRIKDHGFVPFSNNELDHPLLLTVQDGERVELLAIQTLKTKMLLTRGLEEAMRCLANGLVERDWCGDGFIGFTPSVSVLVNEYARQSQRTPWLVRRLRTMQLTSVSMPAGVPGAMRLCLPSDRDLLAKFVVAFATEIGEPSDDDGSDRADRGIREGRSFFWVVDDQPVALAGSAGRTPNGIRINSVYTPVEFRRRGFASNLVAHLSQRLLDGGRKFCFLHTDLANPTSNGIYQKMGYRPVCDGESWDFGEPASAF